MQDFRKSLEDALAYTRNNLVTIRTGRASPTLVENISVTTYGGQATLKVIELATITTSGAQEILISLTKSVRRSS